MPILSVGAADGADELREPEAVPSRRAEGLAALPLITPSPSSRRASSLLPPPDDIEWNLSLPPPSPPSMKWVVGPTADRPVEPVMDLTEGDLAESEVSLEILAEEVVRADIEDGAAAAGEKDVDLTEDDDIDVEMIASAPSADGALEGPPSSEVIEVDEADLEPPSLPREIAAGDPQWAPSQAAAPQDLGDAMPEPPPSSAASTPRPSVVPSATARVVMVVEDDATIREMLTRSLGTEYCVYEASDGVTALAMLQRMSAPDLFLFDVRMPKMDGLALAVRMREDTRMRRVPIIFLSGLDAPRDIVNGINAGARQYVTKPFKMKDLLRRVDRAIKHRSV
jgi:CheY-like chemotaxis protein